MELSMTERYDQALLGILQHVGNIQDFLTVYFGFLYRKTDFYRLLLSEQDRMGFPPGVARSMVMKAFKSFEHLAQQDHEQKVKDLEQKLKKQLDSELSEAPSVPTSAQDIVVETVTETVSADCGAAEIPATGIETPSVAQEAIAVQATSHHSSEPKGAVTGPTLEEHVSFQREQEQFQRNPESYNGAVRDNYTWSQDYNDLEIKVPVPKEVKKGKQVSVDLCSTSIRVAVKEGSSERVLMEGTLTHKINTETSLWSLEPGKCILKVHDMLKKGWDAEGSPFRGQAFDPSLFNISPGAVQF
ncbi:nudC domain-containing protein 3 isoform X2 [Ambystoma mexicanum]|uniref:nudC domain-containing protein 3 isoform X2 n=1 Tax=Ambystoma mexicanum TaxID=8296 RepID=UPI0037E8442A